MASIDNGRVQYPLAAQAAQEGATADQLLDYASAMEAYAADAEDPHEAVMYRTQALTARKLAP